MIESLNTQPSHTLRLQVIEPRPNFQIGRDNETFFLYDIMEKVMALLFAAACDEVRFQQNVTVSSPNDIIVKSWPETWRIGVAVVASPRVFLYHPRDLLSLVQRTRYAHHVPTRKERGRGGQSQRKMDYYPDWPAAGELAIAE